VILIAALIGAGLGALVMLMLFHAGMLAERSGMAVFLAAIAFFYPVFAAQEGDLTAVALHSAIFIGFAILAKYGFRRGMHLLAGGLIGHGVFDFGLHIIGAPGPIWWPAFCGALDIAAGVALIRLLQTQKVPQ
jgi:hypothetical protein